MLVALTVSHVLSLHHGCSTGLIVRQAGQHQPAARSADAGQADRSATTGAHAQSLVCTLWASVLCASFLHRCDLASFDATGGLGALGFGIFGIREGVMRLRPGHTWMEVDPQRLSICRNFRVSTYSWEAVETFEIESVNIGDDTEIDVLQMIMAND